MTRLREILLRLESDEDLKKKLEAELAQAAPKESLETYQPPPAETAGPSEADGEQLDDLRVRAGLQKTRKHFFSRLRGLIAGSREIDAGTLGALEELLITSDLGVKTSAALLERLKADVESQGGMTEEQLRRLLRQFVLGILQDEREVAIVPTKVGAATKVVLVVGVNGVGKTTTIGKLAARFSADGAKIVVAACDTFRAAAVEQLQAWGERAGVEVIRGEENAKPSTVAYQAVHRANELQADVLLVDTAGRLHTRVNLMNELSNVSKIIARELPGAPHETLLVLDASTGQNALQQAKEFDQATKLTGIIMTKLDGTPKGGILVAVKDELQVPIRYIGVGEGVRDLREFSAEEFANALFDIEGEEIQAEAPQEKLVANGSTQQSDDLSGVSSGEKKGERKVVRRRRREQL